MWKVDDYLIDILQGYRVTIDLSSKWGFGAEATEERGLYFTATIVVDSDTTKLTGTAWGDSGYAALLGALTSVQRQIEALRRAI